MHNKQHTTLSHTCNHTISLSIAPGDYGALTGFPLGPFSNSVRQLSFNVSIVDDVTPEGTETFTANLTLSPADRARLGDRVTVDPDLATVDPDLATVTILHNDGTILSVCVCNGCGMFWWLD